MPAGVDDPMNESERLLMELAAGQKTLADSLTALLRRTAPTSITASVEAKNSTMARPEPFKSGAKDARRFLHYYALWANAQGLPLNTITNGVKQKDDAQWIAHALALLQGEAAEWAVPYLQALEAYHRDNELPAPFDNRWDTFVDAFKARFQAMDDTLAAQRELDSVRQGTKTIADYAARFQAVAGRTNFSSADLMARFRQGLNEQSRNLVALGTLDEASRPTTLDGLVRKAVALEAHMTAASGRGAAPFGASPPPRRDPYAMEIDATRSSNGRTVEEFKRLMRGRCYGCGGQGHNKRDCETTKGRICAYCERPNHKETVCQDKFMGVARGRGRKQQARVAATVMEEFTLFPEETPAGSATITQATPSVSINASSSGQFNALFEAIQTQNQLLSALTSRSGF